MAINQTAKEKPKITWPEYMSVASLVAYSSMSKSTLRKWILAGMPYYKLGRSIRIKRSDFDEWLEQFRANGSTEHDHLQAIWDEVVEEVQ